MPTYIYFCPEHGHFEVKEPMMQPHEQHDCVTCGAVSLRRFKALDVIYNAQGFERTDNMKGNVGGGTADRKEILNRDWSRHFNEPPPKPAKHVPKRH